MTIETPSRPGSPRRVGRHYPPVRIRPAPATEPPYEPPSRAPTCLSRSSGRADPSAPPDSELPGQLALTFPATTNQPAATAATDAVAADPALRLAARQLVARYVEILNGHRPGGHLRLVACPADADRLLAQLPDARARLAAPRRREPDAASRRPQGKGSAATLTVRSVRLAAAGPDTADVVALVELAGRVRAVAGQLRLTDRGVWRFADLLLVA
ncbi:Rv3235 family protein [Pilimelia columellifera]|uniref:Uncharacterized protein n=1 Tax=Pilimelia columellifera subsp. columellifera TaxID=706583 RepID=A0ABP6AU97_9ACTN